MIQILYGDQAHKARCEALALVTPGSSVDDASGPAVDRKGTVKLEILTFWAHGNAQELGRLTAPQFVDKVKAWVKLNPTIKTVEIITCNARHHTEISTKAPDGAINLNRIESYTDQAKPSLKKMGLTVKALPMGMSTGGVFNRWSILKWSSTTKTWLYVTAGGAKDTDIMFPGVNLIENDPLFTATKNYVTAGAAVKARETMRQYTIDYGTVTELRGALIKLA